MLNVCICHSIHVCTLPIANRTRAFCSENFFPQMSPYLLLLTMYEQVNYLLCQCASSVLSKDAQTDNSELDNSCDNEQNIFRNLSALITCWVYLAYKHLKCLCYIFLYICWFLNMKFQKNWCVGTEHRIWIFQMRKIRYFQKKKGIGTITPEKLNH